MATINDARLREILLGSPTVAVLGIHREPEKAAFYVPEYLHDEGYKVIGGSTAAVSMVTGTSANLSFCLPIWSMISDECSMRS